MQEMQQPVRTASAGFMHFYFIQTLNTFLPQVISKPEGVILLSTEQLAGTKGKITKKPHDTHLPLKLVNS